MQLSTIAAVSIEIPGTGGSTLSKAGRHNWRVVRTAFQGAVDAGIAEWREAVCVEA
jgi:hypothetical protein